MANMDSQEILYIISAFIFQVILIAHFSLRRWAFESYIQKYGWLVYALSVPAVIASLLLLLANKPWSLWASGFIYLFWGIFGYNVEYK